MNRISSVILSAILGAAVFGAGLTFARPAQAVDEPQWKQVKGNEWSKSTAYTNFSYSEYVPRNGVVGGWVGIQTAPWDTAGKFVGRLLFWPIKIADYVTTIRNLTSALPLAICRAHPKSTSPPDVWRIGYLQYDKIHQAKKCWIVGETSAPFGGKPELVGRTSGWQALIAPESLAHWYPPTHPRLQPNMRVFDFFRPGRGGRANLKAYSTEELETTLFNGNRPCRVWVKAGALRRALNMLGVMKAKTGFNVYVGNVDNKTKTCRYVYDVGKSLPKIGTTKNYSVLYLGRDFAKKDDNDPIILRARGTNLCALPKQDKRNLLVLAYRKCDGGSRRFLRFMKNNKLRFAYRSTNKKLYEVCATAIGKSDGVGLISNCKGVRDQIWRMTHDNKVVNALFGSCLGTRSGGKPKEGEEIFIAKACDNATVWDVLPAVKVLVAQKKGNHELPVTVSGQKSKKCPAELGGCSDYFLPGTKVTVKVGNVQDIEFGSWDSGPCRNKKSPACTFTVSKKGADLGFLAYKSLKKGTFLQVKKSGRCIDNKTGNLKTTKKGTGLYTWTCVKGAQNQFFTFVVGGLKGFTKDAIKKMRGNPAFQIKNNKGGLCLEVKDYKTHNGAVVHQAPCKWNENQKWKKVHRGGGWFQLISQLSGMCLDLQGGRMGNRVPLQMWKCAGGKAGHPNQLFRDLGAFSNAQAAAYMRQAEKEVARAMTPVRLRNQRSDKCLDTTGKMKNGTQLQQWECVSHDNLLFILKENGDLLSFRSVKANLCLDVYGSSKSNGGKIVLWPCNGLKNQLWKPIGLSKDSRGDWFTLKSVHSGKCLDLAYGKTNNGAKYHQWDCNTKNPSQRFRIDG